MSNFLGLVCPRCGDGDHIDVEARVSVRLTYDGTSTDDASCHDTEWDDDSPALCGLCGWVGVVGDLDREDEEGV